MTNPLSPLELRKLADEQPLCHCDPGPTGLNFCGKCVPCRTRKRLRDAAAEIERMETEGGMFREYLLRDNQENIARGKIADVKHRARAALSTPPAPTLGERLVRLVKRGGVVWPGGYGHYGAATGGVRDITGVNGFLGFYPTLESAVAAAEASEAPAPPARGEGE